MPCSSHFTSSPPASAAVCAAVGWGFSATSLPPESEEDDDDDEFELLPLLSLLLKLQAITTSTIAAIAVSCFIGVTTIILRFKVKRLLRQTVDSSQRGAYYYLQFNQGACYAWRSPFSSSNFKVRLPAKPERFLCTTTDIQL